jgi:hypothetical protein
MNKPLSYALFGGGASAAVLGIAADQPFSAVSPLYGDTLMGETAWLLLIGVVVAVRARVVPARLQLLTLT